MVRTQIYLTKNESRQLARLAEQSGRQRSELIREAIDGFVARHRSGPERMAGLRAGFGLWKDRRDLPDFADIRRGLDR